MMALVELVRGLQTSEQTIEAASLFLQAVGGIRDGHVTGVQTCALPIWRYSASFVLRSSSIALRNASRVCFTRASTLPSVPGPCALLAVSIAARIASYSR